MEKYVWGNNRRFNAFSNYSIKTFGSRYQKLSLDAGFTCPNRDGSISVNGCTFCSNDAFNPTYCSPVKSITQQLDEGIEFHRKRYRRAGKYIAYFQAYSNTYAPLELLIKRYEEALSHPEIVGLSIGTRPDCIDDEKLDYLQSLKNDHFISIEYGIESCYNKTLKKINRGHSFEKTVEAIQATAERNIFMVAHLVLGLPGENLEEMLDEASIISTLPINCVKLHQLQILKNTAVEKEYLENTSEFKIFKLEEYIDFIIDFLERLSPDIMIERLIGEVPPRFLAYPAWSLLRNDQILNMIEKKMEQRDTWQGKLYRNK
jgi:radical SAM protein (TIGR01212 family)